VDRPRGDGAAGPDCEEGYDRLIGLQLEDVVVDGCITKAPCGGEMAGRSPVDRGKQGTKRSILVDAAGIPLGVVQAPANRNDSPLLASTLDTLADRALPPGETTVHLDRGYDSGKTRTELDRRGLAPCIAKLGKPAPLRATSRWVVERTNAWHNAFKKLAWCTERRGVVVRFLRRPGERHHHRPPPGPRGVETLPLGHPPEALSMNASITYWRKLLGERARRHPVSATIWPPWRSESTPGSEKTQW